MRNQKGQLPQAEIILVYVLLGVACLLTAAFYRSHAPEPVKPLLQRTVTDLEQVKGKAGEAVDLKALYRSTPDLIAKGKTAYENTCASCHGNTGKGDGMAAAALNPKPRNFHTNNGWINPRTISGLFKTLQEGLPGTAMSAYDYVSVADRLAIIHYLRSLGDYPAASEADMNALDAKYNLSSGEKIPHQIPVAKAMKILVAEASNPSASKTDDAKSEHNSSSFDAALAAKGKTLFMTCGACHSLDGTRRVGPSLKDVFGRSTKLTNGKSIKADEAYLTNSIKNPNADVVAGYPPIMTKLPMSDSDVKALVEYLKSLSAPVKKVEAPSTGVDTVLAAKGKTLFMTCGACHSLDGTRRVGPSLKGAFGRTTKLTNGKSVKVDADYIFNSIKNPNSDVVAGYPPIMTKMPYSDSDIKALVEYIKTL
ncbi:MAG: cytochrome c [Candidatus Cloacimonetes bacterium]|nr:cytochrome c [Candidatus Cloacimonadota bacterium]